MRNFWYRCIDWRCCVRRVAIPGLLAVTLSACEIASPSGPSTSKPFFDVSAELVFCADEINRYRASAGYRTLTRSADLEGFAAKAAEVDTLAHVAHHHFSTTNGGGTSMAETEILWWRGYPVHAVIEQGLAQMWHSGPGSNHHAVLAGSFTQVGCGIFVDGTEVTVSQDFR